MCGLRVLNVFQHASRAAGAVDWLEPTDRIKGHLLVDPAALRNFRTEN